MKLETFLTRREGEASLANKLHTLVNFVAAHYAVQYA